MNNEINNAINIGAPAFTHIHISFDELLQIASNKELFEERLGHIHRYIYNMVHFNKNFAYHRVDKDDLESIKACLIDENPIKGIIISPSLEDSISHIHLDPFPFFCEIQEILNLNGCAFTHKTFSNYTNNDLINALNQRLELLSNIKTVAELRREFPLLYIDYLKGTKILKTYEENKDEIENKNDVIEAISRCGIRYRFDYFIEMQHKIYSRYVNNFPLFVDMCKDKDRIKKKEIINNTDLLDGIDSNKLQLLICYKFIQSVYMFNKSNDAQMALFYIIPYLSNNSLRDVTITIDGLEIDHNYVKTAYIYITSKFKDIALYNKPRESFKGLTKKETIEKINSEKEMYYTKKKSLGDGKKHKLTSEHTTVVKVQKSDEEINDIYNRKIAILENSNYLQKFYTEDGYDGYIYFVYPNGKIIREKYFDNYRTYRLADDEAVYVSDIYNFDSLHNLNKLELIKKPKEVVRRYFHTKSYEDNMRSVIEVPTDDKTLKDTKEFVERVRRLGTLH